jgi:repressor LexA
MQTTKPLTAKQKKALDYIRNCVAHNGYAPSLKEIAKFLGTENLSTAQYYIEELLVKGHLTKDNNKSRGITPVNATFEIPLLGFIAAGEPIEPIENSENITVPESININTQSPHYALKVKGDSMMDMGILNNDIVIVKHQMTAENGDVVVAITEKGATLKVFKRVGDQIRLEARNKNFQAIIPVSLEIRGKFVGLIRPSSIQ